MVKKATKDDDKENRAKEGRKERKVTDWHEFMIRPRPPRKERKVTDWFEFMRTPRSGQKPSLTPNEEQIFSLLRNHGGEMSVFDIAKELGMTTDYTRMLCESLGRKDIINVFAKGIAGFPKVGKAQNRC